MGVQKIIKFFGFVFLVLFASYSSIIDTQNRLSILKDSELIISGTNEDVIKKSSYSAVRILSTNMLQDEEGITSTSSGTYISHNNSHYVVTSAHSLIGECYTTVVMADEFVFHCIEIISFDPYKDVAIIEVDKIFNRNPIKISDILYGEREIKNNTGLHETTLYTGYPQGIGPLTFDGKIVSHSIQNDTFFVNSYAWSGSSGSGVFNSKGKLVGIITAVSVANTEHGVDVMEDLIIVTSLNLVDFRDVL
tara:strand:+ start:405 stop:1151 length:747 start_codon:yes stop_codon:yes gene_type:complete